jgi:hypothetical protein
MTSAHWEAASTQTTKELVEMGIGFRGEGRNGRWM